MWRLSFSNSHLARVYFRTNHSCRLQPAHQGGKTGDVVAAHLPEPYTSPAGFQLSLERRVPGAGGYFRTNHSCQPGPAHQGVKIRTLLGGLLY